MPPSIPNLNGSTDPTAIAYGPITSFPKETFPGYNATKSTLYRSTDGKVVTVVTEGGGSGHTTYPCNEFLHVVRGWIKFDVKGGDKFTVHPGECAQLLKGITVEYDCSKDFIGTAVFTDTQRITFL